jgi:phage I-like protein
MTGQRGYYDWLMAARDVGGAPREVVLCPDGDVQSLHGTFIVDAESGRLIVEQFRRHGVRVPIDWDHSTLRGDAGKAPAAGWIFDVRYEAGRGIVGSVEWTEEGAGDIRAKHYLYLSPVVIVRKADRKAVGLHSAALTNKPAIPRMDALAASARSFFERDFDMSGGTKTQANQMPEDEGTTPDQEIGEIAAMLRSKGVDLPDGAGRAAVLAAVKSFLAGGGEKKEGEKKEGEAEKVAASVRRELGCKPDAPEAAVMLALHAVKRKVAPDGEAAKLQAQVSELAAWKAERTAEDLVANAVKENKLNPNSKEQMGWAREYAKKDPAGFTTFIAAQAAYVAPGKTAAPAATPGAGAVDEDLLIANAVKEHDNDYGKGLAALQVELLAPLREQGLTNKAANQLAAERYPKIFGAAA